MSARTLTSKEVKCRIQSLDGISLSAIVVLPNLRNNDCVVLVHGITVDKDEGGFYKSIASELVKHGLASLRFDLRGHGESTGSYEDLTLLGAVNDIAAVCEYAIDYLHCPNLHLIAASFGGGLVAYYATQQPKIESIVLLNPLLDYKKRMLDSKPFWNGVSLTDEGKRQLRERGWLPHGDFRMGRALINELLHFRPYEYMNQIRCPVLTIHGSLDSMVPYDIAQKNYRCNNQSMFLSIEGADHGFIVPGDEKLEDPRTIQYRASVIQSTIDWIKRHVSDRR